MVAKAQTCTGSLAEMVSPPNGSVLPAGADTFTWCNANADYFLTVESVPGAHDIFNAIVTVTSITLGPACAQTPPIQCIPPNGETIYVALWTQIKGVWNGPNNYTFTAASPTVFSPTSLNLGTVLLGATSGVKKITLSNIGSVSLLISSVKASGNFSETDTCSGQTLATSGTCTISVKFTPSVTGTIPGALTITDSAVNSPQVVALSGNAVGPISLSPTSATFGTVTVGTTSPPQTITLTNNTGGALVYAFSASANYTALGSGTQPCTGTLAGKAHCTISVTFTPAANGSANGSLQVSSASFPTQLVSFSGTGSGGGTSPLTFAPLTRSFGNTLVGTTSAANKVTVTNSSASPVNITNFVASGDFGVEGSGTTPCGGTLGVGASCTVTATFSPSLAKSIKGTVTFTDDAPINTQLYNLGGNGVLPVSFSPTAVTFSAQTVGTTSSPSIITLANNQAVALNLASLAASGQFTASSGGTNPCGSTIGAHSSCTFAVTFTPKQQGTIPGVVTVMHDASGNPQEVKLTGTGQ